MYDAVSICAERLSLQPGGRAMVIHSDGVDYGSKTDLNTAIRAALRSDVVIYAIPFSDLAFYGTSADARDSTLAGKAVLSALSEATGGHFLEVANKRNIEQLFDIIAAELCCRYSIGNVPINHLPNRKFVS